MNNLKSKGKLIPLILIVAGLWLVLFPTFPLKIICMVLGLFILVQGIMKIVDAVKAPAGTGSSLFMGIVFSVVGGVLVLSPNFIISIFPTVVGIYILIEGINEIRMALQLRQALSSRWLPALLVGAAIAIVGVIIIFNPFGALSVTLRVAGIALIISGVGEFFSK